MGLDSAPVEILDTIISELDRTSDLLHLSLCSLFLRKLIIPRHLQYRVIRCSTSEGLELWKLLEKDKNLARNVRVLEIESQSADDLELAYNLPSGHQPSLLPFQFANAELESALEDNGSSLSDSEEDRLAMVYQVDPVDLAFKKALENMKRLVRFKWGPVHHDPSNPAVKGDQKVIWEILQSIPTLRHLEVTDWVRAGVINSIAIHSQVLTTGSFYCGRR